MASSVALWKRGKEFDEVSTTKKGIHWSVPTKMRSNELAGAAFPDMNNFK
jgi:hypothetical protein